VRWLRLIPFFLLGLSFFFLGPSAGLTQSGRSRFGGGGFDPNMIFTKYSGGKDYIDIATDGRNSRDPSTPQNLADFAQRNGITNGRLTREQFAKYMQERMASRGMGGPPSGGPPASPSTSGATATPSKETRTDGGWTDEDRARESFRRRDKNSDGVLTSDEMSEELRAELARWDTDHNGVISFEEYKEYYKARRAFLLGDSGGNRDGNPLGADGPVSQTPAAQEEEDPRPKVYRAGNLPKDIPSWFAQLDRDQDGQIGLYEWRDSGRPLAEFLEIDQNRDGFCTVEEVMRHQKYKELLASRKPAPGAGGSAVNSNSSMMLGAGMDPSGEAGATGASGTTNPGAKGSPGSTGSSGRMNGMRGGFGNKGDKSDKGDGGQKPDRRR